MTIARPFEIGAFTFGEITADPITGRPIDPAVRLREFIDLATLADQAGLDVFGAGEHHRPDFAIASPPVVLAAIDTPMLRGALEQFGLTEEGYAPQLSLLNRFGQPREVAEASLWLASDQSSYVTGTVIHVDAGYTSR